MTEHSESTQRQQPKKIVPRHRILMRLLVTGKTLRDASEELGYSFQRASVIVNSPLFKEEMDKMQDTIHEEFVKAETERMVNDPARKLLEESSDAAARTLKGALNDQSGSVRINAAKDILDRTGYAKEDKIKANVLVEPSPGLLNALARLGVNSGKQADAEGKGDAGK